jgi:hypothetical protein
MPAGIAERSGAVNKKLYIWVTTLAGVKFTYNDISMLPHMPGRYGAKIGPAAKFLANLG